MPKEKPYIEKKRVVIDRFYNPKYGDDRICKCGHPYYRHFDSYEKNAPVGCKYCDCYTFDEETEKNVLHIEFSYNEIDGFKMMDHSFVHEMLHIASSIVKVEEEIPDQEIFFRVAEIKKPNIKLKDLVGFNIRYQDKIYDLIS
jgi:hypothetical protein